MKEVDLLVAVISCPGDLSVAMQRVTVYLFFLYPPGLGLITPGQFELYTILLAKCRVTPLEKV